MAPKPLRLNLLILNSSGKSDQPDKAVRIQGLFDFLDSGWTLIIVPAPVARVYIEDTSGRSTGPTCQSTLRALYELPSVLGSRRYR